MLAVALENDLNVPGLNCVDQNIRKPGLNARVKVDLWLLEKDSRTFGSVIAQRNHGKDLRDPESYVRNQYLGRPRMATDPDLEKAAPSGDCAHCERIDEAKFLEPFRDPLLNRRSRSTSAAREFHSCLARGKYGAPHPLTAPA